MNAYEQTCQVFPGNLFTFALMSTKQVIEIEDGNFYETTDFIFSKTPIIDSDEYIYEFKIK